MVISSICTRRVVELYGEKSRVSEKRLLEPRVCKPPIISDEYFQNKWTCNKKMEGPFGYPKDTVCRSQCNTGATPLRGTSMKIKCVDLRSRHDGISKEWNPKPLFCKPDVCDTKYIKSKGITENGKWEPESCILQQKVLVGTVCRFRCNENAQWRDYGSKPEATCSRGGAWRSYTDQTNGWSRAGCIIRPSLNTPPPNSPWRPSNHKTIHPSYLSRHKERQQQKTKEDRMDKILSGEIEDSSIQEKDEALAWKHNKTLEKEQKEFQEKVIRIISDSGHDPDKVLAVAEQFKERGESYSIKDGKVFKLTNPPPQPKLIHKAELLGDTARVNNGVMEVIDGMKEVVEGSSNIVLIVVLSCLGVTIFVIVILGIYFKTRKKRAYAVVDEMGEQLLPMNYNINNNSKIQRATSAASQNHTVSHDGINNNNHHHSNIDSYSEGEECCPNGHIYRSNNKHYRYPSSQRRYAPMKKSKYKGRADRIRHFKKHYKPCYEKQIPTRRCQDSSSTSQYTSEEDMENEFGSQDKLLDKRNEKGRSINFVIN